MNGKVKWYDPVKGFGFILTEEDKDIFVHRTGLAEAGAVLSPEDQVSFDIEEGKKGPIAVNVRREN